MQTSMTFSCFSRALGAGVFSETKGKLFFLKLIHHSACGAEPFVYTPNGSSWAPAPLKMKPLPPFETSVVNNQGTQHNIFNIGLWKKISRLYDLVKLTVAQLAKSSLPRYVSGMCVYHCPHISLPPHSSNVWIITAVFTFTDNFAHLLNVGSFPDETDRTAMVSGSVL
jgi:hypothetical protein